jgi:hypothetical protein
MTLFSWWRHARDGAGESSGLAAQSTAQLMIKR